MGVRAEVQPKAAGAAVPRGQATCARKTEMGAGGGFLTGPPRAHPGRPSPRVGGTVNRTEGLPPHEGASLSEVGRFRRCDEGLSSVDLTFRERETVLGGVGLTSQAGPLAKGPEKAEAGEMKPQSSSDPRRQLLRERTRREQWAGPSPTTARSRIHSTASSPGGNPEPLA